MTDQAKNPGLRSVDALRYLAQEDGIGTFLDDNVLLDPSATGAYGFGMEFAESVMAVYTQVGDGAVWPKVFMTVGLAIDIPTIEPVLDWVNERNRHCTIGKYYCGVDREGGKSAVVFEEGIWGSLFQSTLDGGPDGKRSAAPELMTSWKAAVDSAVNDSVALRATHGGRRFHPDYAGVPTLLLIAGA